MSGTTYRDRATNRVVTLTGDEAAGLAHGVDAQNLLQVSYGERAQQRQHDPPSPTHQVRAPDVGPIVGSSHDVRGRGGLPVQP